MKLFVFGLGYSSLAFVRRYRDRFSRVSGTARTPDKVARLRDDGIASHVFDGTRADAAVARDLAEADALLASVPPGHAGDPCLRIFAEDIARSPALTWIGYLSTVGVYGDHDGAWVDEATPLKPVSLRSRQRVEAEAAWLALGERTGKAVQIFRLAGIHGPGRNALVNLARGTARRIVKPGQVFNRIHVDDIGAALAASLDRPAAGAVYNVTDNEPAPPQDVVACAAQLLDVPVPPDIPFADADLSPMGRSFYGENKRVSNRRMREELGVRLVYPTYREALMALSTAGEGRTAPHADG